MKILARFRVRKLWIVVVCFAAASTAVSQTKQISQDEYYSQLHKAVEETAKVVPRRITAIQVEFASGSQESKESRVEEYSAGGRSKKYIEWVSGTEKEVEQYISIGTTYFCKLGKAPWKRSRSRCERMEITTSPTPKSVEFTLEEESEGGASNSIYRMYRTHIWEGVEYFTEQKFIVSARKVLSSMNVVSGKAQGKLLSSTTSETYEYDIPAPKIVAPIK